MPIPNTDATKKTPFTKNTTATINPIVNNKLLKPFIFDFILLVNYEFNFFINNHRLRLTGKPKESIQNDSLIWAYSNRRKWAIFVFYYQHYLTCLKVVYILFHCFTISSLNLVGSPSDHWTCGKWRFGISIIVENVLPVHFSLFSSVELYLWRDTIHCLHPLPTTFLP